MTPNGRPEHGNNPRLFLWAGRVLFLGPVQDGATHAHHAVQVTGCLGGPEPLPPRDERIDQVLAFIKGLPQKQVGLPDLAKQVYLSEGRLIHLLTEQVGNPAPKIPPLGEAKKELP